jgi:hypothetical protein
MGEGRLMDKGWKGRRARVRGGKGGGQETQANMPARKVGKYRPVSLHGQGGREEHRGGKGRKIEGTLIQIAIRGFKMVQGG